jgi:predicted nucleic acid-binding protein
MSLNPPSVFLDHSYLVAISDVEHPQHEDAVDTYRSLLDDFVEQRCLLVARADHLQLVGADLATKELFAAVDKLHIARQHRNAAADLTARTGVGIEDAITMVLLRRHKIRRVLSFDEHFAGYDADGKVGVPTRTTSFVRNDVDTGALAPEAG